MRLLLPLLACLLVAPLLRAAPAGNLEVRLAAQAAPKNLGPLVLATEETRSAAFDLPLNHLSEPIAAPGRIFRIELAANPTPLATITLPETGRSFVILLVPGAESGFEAVVIPARNGTFRPGDYYCHNTSNKPVLGKVGTTKFVLPPRTGEVVRPQGAREGRFYDVTLGVREGEGSRVISTSRWPVGNQMRTYVFFFDNPKRGDVDFRAIDEFVPPEEE